MDLLIYIILGFIVIKYFVIFYTKKGKNGITKSVIILLSFGFCSSSCSGRVTLLLNASFCKENCDINKIHNSAIYSCKIHNRLEICYEDHTFKNNRIECMKFGINVTHFILKKYIVEYPKDIPLISKFIERAIKSASNTNVEIILEKYYYDDFLCLMRILKAPDNLITRIVGLDLKFVFNFLLDFEIVYSKNLKYFLKSLGLNFFLHCKFSNRLNQIDFSKCLSSGINTSLVVVFVEQYLRFTFTRFQKLNDLCPRHPYSLHLNRDFTDNLCSKKSRIIVADSNKSFFDEFLRKKILYATLKLLLNAMKLKKLVISHLSQNFNCDSNKFANLIPFSCVKIIIKMFRNEQTFLSYLYPILKRPMIKKLKLYINEMFFETIEFIKQLKNINTISIHYCLPNNVNIIEKILELPNYLPATQISLTLTNEIIETLSLLPKEYLNSMTNKNLALHIDFPKNIDILFSKIYKTLNLENFIETLKIGCNETLNKNQAKILSMFKNIKDFSLFFRIIGDSLYYKLQEFDFVSNFNFMKKILIFNSTISLELFYFVFHSKTLKRVYFTQIDISEAMNSNFNFPNFNFCVEKFYLKQINRPFNRNLLEYLQCFKQLKFIEISSIAPQLRIHFDIHFHTTNDKLLEFFNDDKVDSDGFLYIKKLNMCQITFDSELLNGIFDKHWSLKNICELNLASTILYNKDMSFLSSLKLLTSIHFEKVKFVNCFFSDILSKYMLKNITVLYLDNIEFVKNDFIKISQLKNLELFSAYFGDHFSINRIKFVSLNDFLFHLETRVLL
ncbi:hypothetical protein CWI37_0088p0050 [Hamiltosporidium tvaerminnensis]|uniref:Uncharacterized protein n=1 Tax=Hamiltosporidium tvaerminnensis TaxID=1176355 RepID=A0A4V2JVS7_9MICR|nr:hypothetical protein CWI37_0088p0050 [Hamiltosporidium tvaerminnensis]